MPRQERPTITRSSSISLDIVRAIAALTVFLQHVHWLEMDNGHLAFVTRESGHAAVIVFFVLSGFVISQSTERTRSVAEYAVKRFSRVYSVAVPALLLAIVVEVAQSWNGGATEYELRRPLLYLPLHLAFAGDLGPLTISAFGDEPYWSLNYEVWYYAAFGAATFFRGYVRWAALALFAVVMWPKLDLLLPVWLGGVAVHALAGRVTPARAVGRAAVAAAVVGMVLFFALHLDAPVARFGEDAFGRLTPAWLRYSQWFLADYVVGALAMAMVWGLCGAEIAWPAWLARAGRGLATVSFGLYLAHFPLLLLLGMWLPQHGPLAAVLAFVIAVGFALVFEPQRDRLRRVLHASFPRLLARPSI